MNAKANFKPRVLLVLLCSAFSTYAAAETTAKADEAVELQEVQIKATRGAKKLGEEKIKRKQLDANLVQDIRDLVRYDPGVSVVEGGRAGSNGFAIRGVDKDRVAVVVDGLAQAESRSSEAFQELFGAYGNFNTNRNAAELEHISEVNILKGADSLSAGSGALGGAVLYSTKSPKDYLDGEKNYHLGLKSAYSSKSDQWMGSVTAAGKLGDVEGLFVMTRRHGHETKNHSGDGGNANIDYTDENSYRYVGVIRSTPDPVSSQSNSTLVKLGWDITPENNLTGIYEDYRQDKKTDELSNLFSYTLMDKRLRNDVSYRKRTGVEFTNLLEQGPWDKLKLNADKQDIQMTTMTWDLPTDVASRGRNAEAYFMRRGLYQKLTQFKAAAQKHVEFESWPWFKWDTAYGIGMNKGRYTNSNLQYFSKIFYPKVLGSNVATDEFLVSTKNRNSHIYWDNAFRFGEAVKFNLGLRYDQVRMQTLESANLAPKVRRELEWKGIWNKQAKFAAPSYAVGLDWKVVPSVTLQGKFSTAFRAPTTDEMWFFFPNRDFYVQPNPDLKDERAKNLELGIDWRGDWGNVSLSGFHTRYRNFIDFVYIGGKRHEVMGADGVIRKENWISPTFQNLNRQSASVKGIELQSRWKLDSIGLPKGMYTTLAASWLKGRSEGNIPMNALQPFNAVVGIGYQQPENRWSLATNFSYFARKKPEDTTRAYDHPNEVFPFAKHSRNYWLADIIAHYQLGRKITVRGGVFNIFNKKYYAWDTLRSVREFGAVNRVNNRTHAGIERFTASGRNFNLTIEAKF